MYQIELSLSRPLLGLIADPTRLKLGQTKFPQCHMRGNKIAEGELLLNSEHTSKCDKN